MKMIDYWIIESNYIEDVDDPKAHEDAQETWDAINWLKPKLDARVIQNIHYGIMKNRLAEAGKWRKCQVWVGDRPGVEYKRIPEQILAWLKQYRRASSEEDIQAAHVAFEKIHPFVDGNGRTGRMIMNYQRVNVGLDPLCIKASERWEYYKWFDQLPLG